MNPFELNEQGNKIDLSNPEDVALTIKRNEALEKITTTGVEAHKLKFKASLAFEFSCYKCGNCVSIIHPIDSVVDYGIAVEHDELFENCKCKYCLTKYDYNWKRGVLIAKLYDLKGRDKMARRLR